MAISNYTNLKESIVNWSHRADCDLLIDDFIALAEADMFINDNNHESLELRLMETTSTANITSDALALPTGFVSMRSFRVTGDDGYDLRPKTADSLWHRGSTGKPRYFAITSQIEFDVSPDQTYESEMVYYRKPDAITSANPTNDILTNYPNIYLFGALYHLFTYADDEAQANKYLVRFSNAINGANATDEQARYGVAPYARVVGNLP